MLRLVVVLPLLALAAGEGFPLKTWPLHVTVAPTFFTTADLAAVAAAVGPVVAGSPSLSVTAGGDEGFGPSGRVPVTVLIPSPELSDVHAALVEALRTVDARFDDPEYVGAGYRAHVTITTSARMTPAQEVRLEQAAIVDMEPVGPQRLREVVWVSPLR